jgi:hypothetical protein
VDGISVQVLLLRDDLEQVCVCSAGSLAGEDGGLRRGVGGCGGGVEDLVSVRDGVCTLRLRVVGVGPGGSTCPGMASACVLSHSGERRP